MRTALLFLSAIFLAVGSSTVSAEVINSCPSNVAVNSSLVFNCSGNIFDFGHDLSHNPTNPLPLGGSVTLKSVTFLIRNDGFPEWDLNFGFPKPAIGTTQLDFTLFAPSCDCLPGADYFALGMSRFPFRPGLPNESGSNFLITETLSDARGNQNTLSMSGGDEMGSVGVNPREFRVVTTITDNAGDLTGFNEAFAVPEPATEVLLVAGLLGLYATRRRRVVRQD